MSPQAQMIRSDHKLYYLQPHRRERIFIVFSVRSRAMVRLSNVTRAVIASDFAKGTPQAQIARKHGVSCRTVRRWGTRYVETGRIEPKKACGRPTAMSTAARERAYSLFLSNELGGSRYVARQLKTEYLTEKLVAPSTALRGARAFGKAVGDGLVCLRGRPRKQLTKTTRKQRVAFAQANLRRDWQRVLFTDRCKFHFRYPGSKVGRVRYRKASDVCEDAVYTPNRPSCLNVYAGISVHGVTFLQEVTGTTLLKTDFTNLKGDKSRNITKAEYKQVLTRCLLPEGRRIFDGPGLSGWVLQQDGDPTHGIAHAVIEEQRSKCRGTVQLLQGWPGNSPDLSPIENVWGWVDAEVAALGCKIFLEFRAAVQKTFKNIPRRMLSNLFASMPKRMKECIDNEGGKTRY